MFRIIFFNFNFYTEYISYYKTLLARLLAQKEISPNLIENLMLHIFSSCENSFGNWEMFQIETNDKIVIGKSSKKG